MEWTMIVDLIGRSNRIKLSILFQFLSGVLRGGSLKWVYRKIVYVYCRAIRMRLIISRPASLSTHHQRTIRSARARPCITS